VKEGVRRISQAVTGRTDAPPAVRSLLASQGDKKIQSMQVARSPIQSAVKGVINLISSGQLSENQKKLGYDDIFHLYLIITLDSGKSFKIERNEDVNVSGPSVSSDSQVMNVNVKPVTLNEFINNGSKGSGFWRYDARSNNCQKFVRDMLQGSGMLTSELNSFIQQDAAGLFESMPLTEKIAKGLTDFKQRINILVGGKRKLFYKPTGI